MLIVINLRNPNARDWDEFWKASTDPNTPVERFGMRMFVRDLDGDATRIATVLTERMKWARATLRAEDRDCARKNYATVRDCKSHRGIVSGQRIMERRLRIVDEMVKRLDF